MSAGEQLADPGYEHELLHPDREQVIELIGPIIEDGFDQLATKRAGEHSLLTVLEQRMVGGSRAFGDLWTPDGSEEPIMIASELPPELRDRHTALDLLHDGYQFDAVTRSALALDGATEDNVTAYAHIVYSMFKDHPGALEGEHFWVADETEHQLTFDRIHVLSAWAHPELMVGIRRNQVHKGEVPEAETPEELVTYTSWQEPATYISHRNSTRQMPKGSPVRAVMKAISSQELEHFVPYFAASLAIRHNHPDRFAVVVRNLVTNPNMPGTGIDNFEQHAKILAHGGVFDLMESYNLFRRLLHEWQIDKITPQTAESEQALTDIENAMTRLGRGATAFERRQQKTRDRREPDEDGNIVLMLDNPFPGPEKVPVVVGPPKNADDDIRPLDTFVRQGRELYEKHAA